MQNVADAGGMNPNAGGGVHINGDGLVRGCIIRNNSSGGSYDYSCTWPTAGLGGTGNISAEPLFVDLAADDYSLQVRPEMSPCIDAGSNQSWMTGATDPAGNDRLLRGKLRPIVDMGAYEMYIPAPGTVIVLW